MKTYLAGALLATALLAGCGDDEATSEDDAPAGAPADAAATTPASEPAATTAARKGTKIVLGSSQFGRILFDSRKQAIYLFDKETTKKPRCYGDCAAAWPPVLAKGKPRLGKGLKRSLLGTTKRRDGKRQVTYGGHPLYYYAHEGPGQVLCHDVPGFGGLWLVVKRNGEAVPGSNG